MWRHYCPRCTKNWALKRPRMKKSGKRISDRWQKRSCAVQGIGPVWRKLNRCTRSGWIVKILKMEIRKFLSMDDQVSDLLSYRVANQYLCPLFKWGTQQEWEFGLQRVINFPESRKKSERTYLLKTLAGCPQQKEKIQRLLNITILEENGNFTETDILLIFSMLTSGSNGYSTLFNFLQDNWDLIKKR